MPRYRKIQRESEVDLNFIDEVKAIPGGHEIVKCIQCGTCSGSCPTGHLMENGPRGIIGKIRAGLRKEVLASPDIWLCTSCYSCYVRCPQGIKVTDVMYVLKNLSSSEKRSIGKRGFILGKCFMEVVNRLGRNNEPILLTSFFLRARPLALFTNALIGLKLFLRGRMPLGVQRIRDRKGFQAIVAKAERLQEGAAS